MGATGPPCARCTTQRVSPVARRRLVEDLLLLLPLCGCSLLPVTCCLGARGGAQQDDSRPASILNVCSPGHEQ